MEQHLYKIIKNLTLPEAELFRLYGRRTVATKHLTDERVDRFNFHNVNSYIVDGFAAIIDRGHINGFEVHILCSDGIIEIYNLKTQKLITTLNARIGQAKRLNSSKRLPDDVFEKISENMKMRRHYA